MSCKGAMRRNLKNTLDTWSRRWGVKKGPKGSFKSEMSHFINLVGSKRKGGQLGQYLKLIQDILELTMKKNRV